MKTNTEKLLVAEQAAEWLIRLKSATPRERDEFSTWIRQSPVNLGEVLAAQVCEIELHHLFREKCIDVDALLESASNVHDIGTREEAMQEEQPASYQNATRWVGGSGELPRPRRVMAAATIAVAFLFAAMFTLVQISDRRITTAAGEWRTEQLEDGSIVKAGPRTTLLFDLSDKHRVVKLTHGEALFNVAHDTARPFVVETKLAGVRAVGTAFAVSLDDPAQVRVTVQEGVVAVARGSHARALRTTTELPAGESITVRAGEQVAVTRSGTFAAEPVANLGAALAWTNRQLIFETETVEDAVKQFNRRNARQIEIMDPQLQTRAVRGVFEAADPEAFADFLERQGAAAALDRGSRIVLIAPYSAVTSRKADD